MENKNIHKEHRKRVRARYLQEGIENMQDHNIVEFLLFYGIPLKDTNDIAHALVEKFGDLNGILEAPAEELMKVDGMGENTATFISLVRDIAVLYNKRNFIKQSNKDAEDFLISKYSGERREVVYLLSMDSAGKVKRCMKICEGSPDIAIIKTRTIVESAVRFESKNVILAHNHPEGFAVPSQTDVKTTTELATVFKAVGINLADHIIVSEDDAFSMAKNPKYEYLFR